jgi:phage tail sheath protein FI
MPVATTYPGVYIEELPSGVRTITGVATSITAFIGRTPRGPVSEPTRINSFGDFERAFGGLATEYPLTYSVKAFYRNGGSAALIVRLNNGGTAAQFDLPPGGDPLSLEAANDGTWANALSVTVDHATIDPTDTSLFNLRFTDASGIDLETHLNLSVDDAEPRYVVRVLEQRSNLFRVAVSGGNPVVPATQPSAATTTVSTAGTDSGDLAAADYQGSQANKTGIFALDKADLFNLLCIPPDKRGADDTDPAVYIDAMAYCADRRAMLIVDPPSAWSANKETAASTAAAGLSGLNLSGTDSRNAAIYFPRIVEADPNRQGQLDTFAPSGMIAGIMARTDAQRGVWKAPAGLDASLTGVAALEVNLTDDENGQLNPLGINCLRSFPVTGRVVWGARTLRGADIQADEYKYVPVRRLALFLEESLYRGTQWVVFEPNDAPLWAQIRLNVGAFLQGLFRQGAFQGTTPRDAYFVKCDAETTTQNDINLGRVNILVGFAPLKPAEFVVIQIQQIAGQIES